LRRDAPARARYALARALEATGGDRQRAAILAAQARSDYAESGVAIPQRLVARGSGPR
jgi:hypothetical protein